MRDLFLICHLMGSENKCNLLEVIQEDIKRQKNKVIRDRIKGGWTAAPNGNINLMGRSIPGPILGPGPLPPAATTSIVDPRLVSTAKHYYWYCAGHTAFCFEEVDIIRRFYRVVLMLTLRFDQG
jgi:hypothetical protein